MRGQQHRVEQGPNWVHYVGPVAAGSSLDYPAASSYQSRDIRWSTRRTAEHYGCGLWRVTTYGRGAMRIAAGDSLTFDQLMGRAVLPAFATPIYQPSPIQVDITIGPSNGRTLRIDAGQTIFVFGDSVDLAWVAPGDAASLGPFVDLGPATSSIPLPRPTESLIVEGLLFAEIARVEVPRQQGQDFARLTQVVQTDAASQIYTPIPAGARRLTIARDDAGSIDDCNWQYTMGDATSTARLLDVIPIVGRTTLSSPAIVTNATHVLSPILDEPATWVLHWEIAP